MLKKDVTHQVMMKEEEKDHHLSKKSNRPDEKRDNK